MEHRWVSLRGALWALGALTISVSLFMMDAQAQRLVANQEQRFPLRRWEIGLSAGWNGSETAFYDPFRVVSIQTQTLNAYHGGIDIAYCFTRSASLVLMMQYSEKGYIQTFENTQARFTEQLNYIEIPLLMRMAILEALGVAHQVKYLDFFFLAGPFLSHVIKAYHTPYERSLNGQVFPFHWKQDAAFGYGLRAGIGLGVQWKRHRIRLSGHRVMDLRSYLRSNPRASNKPFEAQQRLWQASLGYAISIGQKIP